MAAKTGKAVGHFGPGKTRKDDYQAFDPGSVKGGGGVNRPTPKKGEAKPAKRGKK